MATPPPSLEIRLLGPLEIVVQGQPIKPLRTRKVGYLLALLTLHAEEEVARDWLAGLLWPDSAEEQARYNLRQALTNLRAALTTEAHRILAPTTRTLRLDLEGAFVDLLMFDKAIAQKEEAGLKQAVALYRGPLLETCLEEWVLAERQRREQDCLKALDWLAERAMQRQEPSQAVGYLRQAIGIDPFRESVQRHLMEALVAEGNQAAAVQVYRELRGLLRRELNITPDPQTQALYQRLRAKNASPVAPTPLPQQPIPLPPLRAVSIPQAITPLVGREEEREQTLDRLASARLLTLTGSGGVGKSRLAMVVAQELAETYAGEIWFVELARLTEGGLVARAVAAALGVQEQAQVPLLQTLTEALLLREGVLILDNCEHLLPACQTLAAELLRACPRLRLLTTSRQPLGVAGETLYLVPSLPFPAPGEDRNPLEFASVQLLAQRLDPPRPLSHFTPPEGAAMAHICRALDGIPLAIELAAGRAKVLSLAQIAERMESRLTLLTHNEGADLPQHQTLRATLDWSYQLLLEPEQRLLCTLSVFAGGCTLEAVESVCEGVSETEVLDILTGLLNKGLVQRREGHNGTPRFLVLETIREYGRERLEAHGEWQPLRERHVCYYLALAEDLEPQIHGPRQKTILDTLEAEYDNFRTALRWALCEGSEETAPERGVRLAAALFWFWQIHGHLTEGRDWLSQALERTEALGDHAARATALHGAAQIAFYQGDYASARPLFERSFAMWGALGNSWGRAYCALYYATTLYHGYDQTEQAFALLEESVALWRQRGDKWGLGVALWTKGALLLFSKKEEEAIRAALEESETLLRESGDKWGLAGPLWYEGIFAREKGERTLAHLYLEEASQITRELGDNARLLMQLRQLVDFALMDNRLIEARAYLHEAVSLCIQLGNERKLCHLLASFGTLAQQQNQLTRAIHLYTASATLWDKKDASPTFGPHTEVAQHLAEIRPLLSEEAYKTAVMQGRAFTLEQAIAYALECEDNLVPS